MDVPPCNPLFDLRLDAQVLSKTLNCSTKGKREILVRKKYSKGRSFYSGLFFRAFSPPLHLPVHVEWKALKFMRRGMMDAISGSPPVWV